MKRVRFWAGALVAVMLATVFIAPAPAQAGGFRVRVNGREVTRWDVAPYEYTPGGRLMVQVNPIVNALGACYHAPWFEADQRKQVWGSGNCDWTKDVYANFYTNSNIVEMYNGLNSIAGVVTYHLDAPALEIDGVIVVPARALGDALACYTEWQESTSTFVFDCGRPPVAHESLDAVMEQYPPELDRDTNKFRVPTVNGGFPMYPKTLDRYVLKTEAANAVMGALRKDTDLLTVGYESWNARARIFSVANRDRTVGYVYGNMTTLRLSPSEQVDYKNRLQRISARNTAVGVVGGALLGVVAPEIEASKILSGAFKALVGLGGAGIGYSTGKSNLERYENCRERAKLEAPVPQAAYVTVSMKWPADFRCIPSDTGDSVLTWEDFGRMGY